MNSILKYPGAKWRVADWVIEHFPEHHSYLEPYFGSGAVFFNKYRSNIETINDLDGDVINLFECIRQDPERLAHEIYFTPYARQVYKNAYEDRSDEPYKRARALFIRCNMGYGYRTTGENVGWKYDLQGRERAYAAGYWADLPRRIMEVAERLRGVQLECQPALELIQRFNYQNVLIYVDPPYMLDTRYGKQYKCEMSDQDHRDLLDVLLTYKGSVVLSGYESELYHDALRGWHVDSINERAQSAGLRREMLWTNFEPIKQMRMDV